MKLGTGSASGLDIFLLNAAVAKTKRETVIDEDRASSSDHKCPADHLVSEDSRIETTACVNHVAHLLFITSLVPTIAENAKNGRKTRIVFTGSALHRSVKDLGALDDFFAASSHNGSSSKPWTLRETYAASKFLQMLGIRALRRRIEDILKEQGVPAGLVEVVVVQPGFVPQTGLSRESSLLTRFAMSYLLPWAPFATSLDDAGKYIADACTIDLPAETSSEPGSEEQDGFHSQMVWCVRHCWKSMQRSNVLALLTCGRETSRCKTNGGLPHAIMYKTHAHCHNQSIAYSSKAVMCTRLIMANHLSPLLRCRFLPWSVPLSPASVSPTQYLPARLPSVHPLPLPLPHPRPYPPHHCPTRLPAWRRCRCRRSTAEHRSRCTSCLTLRRCRTSEKRRCTSSNTCVSTRPCPWLQGCESTLHRPRAVIGDTGGHGSRRNGKLANLGGLFLSKHSGCAARVRFDGSTTRTRSLPKMRNPAYLTWSLGFIFSSSSR